MLGVGAVSVKVGSPYVLLTPLQVNVGVALATVTVIEVVPPEIYEVVSDGVKVAVIIELPYPATVAVLPLTERTEGVPEE